MKQLQWLGVYLSLIVFLLLGSEKVNSMASGSAVGFRERGLKMHNDYRRMYEVQPLHLDQEVSKQPLSYFVSKVESHN
jgi:hypothetical protein